MSRLPHPSDPADPGEPAPIGRRPLLKGALAGLLPWGDAARAEAAPAPTTAGPVPSGRDERDRPFLRFRVVHDVYQQYPATEPLERVIADALEDCENGRAWMVKHGHGHAPGEDLAIWEQGRLAAAIRDRDGGPAVRRFDYPEPEPLGAECYGQFAPWECPDRITYTVATADHELYRCSRLGLTLGRVLAAELRDVRRGRAWCAARGLEPPAEDRTIWENGELVAAILHRPEGPVVLRFDGAATETNGGAL